MTYYAPELVYRAARRSIDGIKEFRPVLDICADEVSDETISPNTDPKLGDGIWVQVYLFLSKSELEDAEDMTS